MEISEYKIDYNKYKPISLICPTRHRCHGIYHFLNSAYRTAWRYDTFEVIFICDEDDKASPLWIEICKDKFPEMNISYYVRERTEFLNRDYFNWGTKFAKGKYFWVVGDDLEFILPHWDRAVFDCLDKYCGRYFDSLIPIKNDRIVYINIKCDTPKPVEVEYDFSCFPIISREAVETVGFFMIPEIPSWCSDYTIALLYNQTNRIMETPVQTFKHIGVETGVIIGDKVTERMNEIMKKYNSQAIAKKWEMEKLPILKNKINQKIRLEKEKAEMENG